MVYSGGLLIVGCVMPLRKPPTLTPALRVAHRRLALKASMCHAASGGGSVMLRSESDLKLDPAMLKTCHGRPDQKHRDRYWPCPFTAGTPVARFCAHRMVSTGQTGEGEGTAGAQNARSPLCVR